MKGPLRGSAPALRAAGNGVTNGPGGPGGRQTDPRGQALLDAYGSASRVLLLITFNYTGFNDLPAGARALVTWLEAGG